MTVWLMLADLYTAGMSASCNLIWRRVTKVLAVMNLIGLDLMSWLWYKGRGVL